MDYPLRDALSELLAEKKLMSVREATDMIFKADYSKDVDSVYAAAKVLESENKCEFRQAKIFGFNDPRKRSVILIWKEEK